ncbi:hypothetical protein PF008_g27326 [Phytophthora fragariae]|uniref:Uncharacterized protein n=1 Tax=Phytophthora fragariae TaxID=53985 RepID=A0A6G0QFD3_9STRA|nr:hypothetical protein PF008_g27326 [Phytophthora fragariae]
MDLLAAIRHDVLKQMEDEAVNFFSCVSDFRGFISRTRPGPDVLVTLKLCCISSKRVSGDSGTCFTGVDAGHRALADRYDTAMERTMYAEVIVWDGKASPGGICNLTYEAGAIYEFHRVEYTGIYDGVAKGYVVYDSTHESRVRLVSPPTFGATPGS